MINPHPPLTSFPVALLLCTLLLECVSRWYRPQLLRQTASVLFTLTCILTFVTYWSGYVGTWMANQSFTVPEEHIAQHQASARLLLFLLVPTAILALCDVRRKSPQRTWYLAFLWLCTAILIWTAYQGGRLVFNHGAGVSLKNPQCNCATSTQLNSP